MAVQGRAALTSAITQQFTSNNAGQITGPILRGYLRDIADSSLNKIDDPLPPLPYYPKVLNRQANLIGDFEAAGDGTANDSAKVQAAIDAIAARGGGELFVPPLEFGIGTPINYKNCVVIVGTGAPPSGIGGPPVFRSSSFKAVASMPAMFTQTNLASPLHSIGMRRCNVDAGQTRGFAVTCAMDLSFINSRFTQNMIRQGTGIGFACRWNPIAAWINWFSENYVEFFNRGVLWEGTDSHIGHNYISSCLSNNIIIDSTGSNQVIGNMIDGAGRNNTSATQNTNGIALVLRNTHYRNVTEQQTRNVVVGNNFGENQANDIVIEAFTPGDGTFMVSTHSITGNKFHNLPGNSILIGEGNRGGIIANNNFSDIQSSTSGAVVFGGTTSRSPGWSLGPNTFTSGSSAAGYLKYVNAPTGTQILGYQ